MRWAWLVVALLLVGCGRIQNERFAGSPAEASSGLAIHMAALPSAPVAQTGRDVTFELTRDGEPVAGAEVMVEANMTHAGMEPLFVEAVEGAPGEYRAPIFWSMGGEWFLRVRATLPDGTTAEETFPGIEVKAR